MPAISRKTLYWLFRISRPHNLFRLVTVPALWLGYRLMKLGQYGPIVLSTSSIRLNEEFAATTLAALTMVERHSPRHLWLLKRELRLICNSELVSAARYDHSLRLCEIDFVQLGLDDSGKCWADPTIEDYEWHLAYYASLLVHEAIHGRLETLHFTYTNETRARIERVCLKEQRRFLALLPRDQYDFRELLPSLDLGYCEGQWGKSNQKYQKQLFRRIWKQELPTD